MRDTSLTLLERLRDGRDELAWQDFLSRYWRPLYVFARRRGCSEASAEEVVQETVAAVFEHAGTFRYDSKRGLFRNWLFTIAIRKLAMMRRGERSAEALAKDAADEPAAPEAQSAERQFESLFEKGLLAAMLELVRREVEPATWQAFEYTALHGVPAAEAAAAVGISRNAVYLARKRILRRLEELGTPYRENGQLDEELKEFLELDVAGPAESRLTDGIAQKLSSAGAATP